jgi:thiol-disulfide isomerase/thioredoxin
MCTRGKLRCLVIFFGCVLLAAAVAQSSGTDDKPNPPKPQVKKKKVWTNEDMGSLGGINVVGRTLPETKSKPAPDKPRHTAGPEFRAISLDGQTFDSDSVAGNVVLVQFWATWCGVCRRDQANVDKVAQHRGVVVLAVNSGESREAVKAYLSGSPRDVNVVLAGDTNLEQLFPSPGVPTYVVLDRDGKVVAKHRGYAGEARLERMLAAAGL